MKAIYSVLLTTVLSFSAFAAKEKTQLKCTNDAVKAAVSTNYKNFKVSTSSCGIKLLHAGEFAETYIVCTSDETDPMEYIAVVSKKKGCKVELIKSTNEASTPTFDDNTGLLKSIECSMEFDVGKLVCN